MHRFGEIIVAVIIALWNKFPFDLKRVSFAAKLFTASDQI